MPLIDNSSILMSIKKLLNIEHDETAFDTDIAMLINGEFMTLQQLGISTNSEFAIIDADTKWSDYITDKSLIETLKTYVYMKVRMIFDPPASSAVADAFKAKIAELEWRLNIQAEENADAAAKVVEAEGSESEEPISNYEIQNENLVITAPTPSITPDPIPEPVVIEPETVVPEEPTPPSAPQELVKPKLYEVQGETLNIFGNLF